MTESRLGTVSHLTSDGDTFIEAVPIIGTQLAGPMDERMKEEEQIRKKRKKSFYFPFFCKKKKRKSLSTVTRRLIEAGRWDGPVNSTHHAILKEPTGSIYLLLSNSKPFHLVA